MQNVIKFFLEVGKLKKMKRTGWILRGVKDPETIAEHTFRMALMAWIFGYSKGLHVEKILKMALIHDLCEIYSGDSTPYDSLLGKKKKIEIKKLVSKWPGFSKAEKERLYKEKQKRERKALEKVIETLSPNFKKEILAFWEDYERGLTKEGRFLKQLDRIESLLQALEYWRQDKNFPIAPWWTQLKSLVDDPYLLQFMDSLDKSFHQK